MMLRLGKLYNWFKDTEKPKKIEWIILFAMIVLFALSYTYNDIIATTRHGIRFWEILFQGKPLEFYNYNYAAPTGNSIYGTAQMAAYDYTVYLIFAVWDFPLWVVEQLFHISATENMFCLMWSKLQLVIVIGLIANVMMKLGKELKMAENTRLWLVFTWLSSVLLCSSTLMMSQYDIFSLFFMLCGVLFYLRGDMKKFVLFFALATSCKYFALLVFLPLLLLRCKKVFVVLGGLLATMSISVFWKLLFSLSATSTIEGVGIVNALLPIFFKWSLSTGIHSVSVFVISMIALCIWCYAAHPQEERFAHYAVFAAAAAMLAFVAESPLYPYWVVLVTPFVTLLIFMNAQQFKLNIFLEMGFSLMLLLQQMIMFYWCFANRTVMPMLFGKLFAHGQEQIAGIGSFLEKINAVLPFRNPAASLMLCCVAALLIFNRPAKLAAQAEKAPCIERSVMWVRLAAFFCVGMLPIVYYIVV